MRMLNVSLVTALIGLFSFSASAQYNTSPIYQSAQIIYTDATQLTQVLAQSGNQTLIGTAQYMMQEAVAFELAAQSSWGALYNMQNALTTLQNTYQQFSNALYTQAGTYQVPQNVYMMTQRLGNAIMQAEFLISQSRNSNPGYGNPWGNPWGNPFGF